MSLDDSRESLMENMVDENSSPCSVIHNSYSSNEFNQSVATETDRDDDSGDGSEDDDYYDREITQNDVLRAELLWTLNCVMTYYPLSDCNQIGELFASMFPDSEVAHRFTYSKDKFMFYLTHGLAPYFQSLLNDELRLADYYVLSVDTCWNKSTSNEQINYHISFWNPVANRVESRYLTSGFLAHTKSEALLATSLDVVKHLDRNKILQLSMVGSMINWSFLKALGESREQDRLPKLINIGSCDIYALHDAFRAGAEKTGWNYADFLTSLFTLVNNSPGVRAENEPGYHMPLEFNYKCWIENGSAAKRAIELWKSIHKLMATWRSRENSRENFSYHLHLLEEFVSDRLIIAKLHFFVFVASTLKPFINNYTTSKPMVPFLHDDHHSIVRKLMSWFVKRNILDNACTARLLCAIDLDNDSNFVDPLNQNIGFGAESFLQVCLKNDSISLEDVADFKKSCTVFLVEVIEKITLKSCLLSSIAENAGSLNPNKMVSHSKLSIMQFDYLSQKLVELKRLTTSQREKTLREYNEFMIRVVSKYKGEFISFKPAEERLDDFLFNKIGLKEYPSLSNVIRLVFCLSHGQPLKCGDLEKYVQSSGMDEACIKSVRTIYDHMSAKNLTSGDFDVNELLLARVNDSFTDYDDFVKSKRDKLIKRRPLLPTFDIKKSVDVSQGNLQQICESYRMDIEKLVAKAQAESTC